MDFSQIVILLIAAAAFGIIAKFLKQPLIIGFLFAGFFLGLSGVISENQTLQSMGQVGITLRLFLLGLEMNLRELPTIGKVAIATGLGQIFFTTLVGLLISLLLGFPLLPAIYISVALTFSSTIIIVKLLSEKKDLNSLYGKIAVGFLLVQDFVAILILMFLAGVGKSDPTFFNYVFVLGKGVSLFILVWILSKKVLPLIFEKLVGGSSELTFIVSIAWALGFAAFVAGPIGFTREIGGLLAGISLSNLSEHLQVASKTRPLRDFFLTIFFLILGTQLVTRGNVLPLLPYSLIFSLFVLFGNPLIVLVIMGIMGYKKRTSFLAGLTVAQISEFSLILMSMGFLLGHVEASHVSLVTIVGVVTMTISTYLILGADRIYGLIKNYLSIFERRRTKEQIFLSEAKMEDHIILVGCDRTGRSLIRYFIKKQLPFLVVDFNPRIFKELTAEKIPVILGDINDQEVLAISHAELASLIISTSGNLTDNLTLLEYLKSLTSKPTSLFTCSLRSEALTLYEKGANYVIVPEVVAGDHIRNLLRIYGVHSDRLKKAGQNHFNRLIFT